MVRKSVLTALVLLSVLAITSIPAGASPRAVQAVKIYKNWQCNATVRPYSFGTWACTTITVPRQTNAGGTMRVTFQFKAKMTMKYVDICFSKMDSLACAYRHKYATINRGSTIKRVLLMKVPATSSAGAHLLDNYSRFYKLPKYASKDVYWTARAFACVTTLEQLNPQCSGGK